MSQIDRPPLDLFSYEVPVLAESPWPLFRRDQRNTGHSPIPAAYHGDHPWHFQTGKGIFSTPVIDGSGTIYVGSADHYFYAISPDGTQKWRFKTGEVIDSAGALLQANLAEDSPSILFPSGDGYLYHMRLDGGSDPADRLIWRFDARVSPRASYNNWFEANVTVGRDGTIYAGNTNFNYYAITPDGRLKWTYETGANAWSCAGIAEDGTLYWASNDTFIRAVDPDGSEKWRKRTLGFLSASAAVGSDGTVYIGSFDSSFYALDPRSGRVKWKFKTGDHIYGSAALDEDEAGRTSAIYIGSTDGIFYALDPAGKLRWTFDTGAPVRSSPVVGQAPSGGAGSIVYFGCGNGKLYALDAQTGARRWSYDTTPDDPELRDRNDLNGSPALGKTGVYIGGEHGQVWYVPYDYPLHAGEDERCSAAPGEGLPADMAGVFYVTPGGNTALVPPERLPTAAIITLRLVVRRGGKTLDAHVYNLPVGRPESALQVRINPAIPFDVEQSADGRYLHIIPQGFFEPDTTYTIHVEGQIYTGGLSIGNLSFGGRKMGRFDDSFSFRTESSGASWLPIIINAEHVTGLELTRMSVPIPTMMPSLNQIGFDYIDWIMGTVAMTGPDRAGQGKVILWVIGGEHDENGTLVAEPESDFTLPLGGVYQGDAFILSHHDFTMPITGIPISFNIFQVRGALGSDLCVRPGATAYGEARVLSIPTFGPLLVLAGLANNIWQKLVTMVTYVTRSYEGPANRRPKGVTVDTIDFVCPEARQDGRVTAHLMVAEGAAYPQNRHRGGILLIEPEKTEVISLDYHNNLTTGADARGNLTTITLRLPAGLELPEMFKAIIILDVYPMHEVLLGRDAAYGTSEVKPCESA